MAFETTPDGGYVVSGEADTRLYQVMMLRRMLALEINTGMRSSKGSPLVMLKKLGIVPEDIRTKKKALEIVTDYLEKQQKQQKERTNDGE